MHIEAFVEEQSAEAALTELIPKILAAPADVRFHVYQGKKDLLANLPRRLNGYRTWLPRDWRIVVLIDEDRQECAALKVRMERAALDAGLTTRASPGADGRFQVLNRLAVEELEAWFIGDPNALRAAYPRISPTFSAKAKFRQPDAVVGGTWEALEKLLKHAGYYESGLAKIKLATEVAARMNVENNMSPSFNAFCSGIRGLCAQ